MAGSVENSPGPLWALCSAMQLDTALESPWALRQESLHVFSLGAGITSIVLFLNLKRVVQNLMAEQTPRELNGATD